MYTKAQLLSMNNDPSYGFNWILNIANIRETQHAVLYPTGSAALGGRFYVALPANHVLTQADKKKWNMF